MSYRNVYREDCKTIYQNMIHAFDWERSPEGHSFWQAIYDRIKLLSAGVTPSDHCLPASSRLVEVLKEMVAERDRTNAELTDEILRLRKKLLTSDFCNMGR